MHIMTIVISLPPNGINYRTTATSSKTISTSTSSSASTSKYHNPHNPFNLMLMYGNVRQTLEMKVKSETVLRHFSLTATKTDDDVGKVEDTKKIKKRQLII